MAAIYLSTHGTSAEEILHAVELIRADMVRLAADAPHSSLKADLRDFLEEDEAAHGPSYSPRRFARSEREYYDLLGGLGRRVGGDRQAGMAAGDAQPPPGRGRHARVGPGHEIGQGSAHRGPVADIIQEWIDRTVRLLLWRRGIRRRTLHLASHMNTGKTPGKAASGQPEERTNQRPRTNLPGMPPSHNRNRLGRLGSVPGVSEQATTDTAGQPAQAATDIPAFSLQSPATIALG